MANIRFLLSSNLDAATMSVSGVAQLSGLPKENVQDQLVRKVFRSTQKPSTWLRFRSSAITAVNGVFIGNHNFTKNAVVYWQGNTTSNFASGPALSTVLPVVTDSQANVIPKICHYFATTYMHKFHRLRIEDGGSVTTLKMGRVIAGRFITPGRNMQDGFEIQTIDPSRGRATMGRQTYWTLKNTYQEFTFSFGWAEKSVQDWMYGIYNEVGQHTAFVLSLNPTTRPTDDSIYCQIMAPLKSQQRVNEVGDISSLTFQEKN